MRIDEYISQDEIRLMETLKGKNRMEQDEIIGVWENAKIR
jgi:hypothetical protein